MGTIIDFHTHIFPPELIRERDRYLFRDDWFRLLYSSPRAQMVTAEELVASMEEAGIHAAVTFGFPFVDTGLCRVANDYVLEAVARYPGRLYGFAVVNPCAPESVHEVERCAAAGLRGVGELMPDAGGYALDDEEVMAPLAETCRALGLPLLIHTSEPVGHVYAGKGSVRPEAAYAFARRFPEITIIYAHWGGGLPFYELMPEVRNTLRHVYYDTAASLYLYDDRIFRLLAEVVGPKILFATDYPLIGQRRFLRHLKEVGLSETMLINILGENARRLLGE